MRLVTEVDIRIQLSSIKSDIRNLEKHYSHSSH